MKEKITRFRKGVKQEKAYKKVIALLLKISPLQSGSGSVMLDP
jgi:hypothetical protein